MATSEDKLREPAKSQSLGEAIREARVQEAEWIDKAADLRSSELARLELLKAELEPLLQEIPETDDRFALVLVQSTPARLWIDMFCHVVFDSERRIYRLVRSARQGRKVLAETSRTEEIAEHVRAYVAHQMIAWERQWAGFPDMQPFSARFIRLQERRRLGLVIAAFGIGILTGICVIFAIGYIITS